MQDIEDLDKLKRCPKNLDECYDFCFLRDQRIKSYDIKDTTWYKVQKIRDIFQIMSKHKSLSYMLVAGNTGKGVYRIKVPPKVYIDVNEVNELKEQSIDKTITLGANISLTDTMKYLLEVGGTDGFEYVLEIVKHIDLVANVPVRNVSFLSSIICMPVII